MNIQYSFKPISEQQQYKYSGLVVESMFHMAFNEF